MSIKSIWGWFTSPFSWLGRKVLKLAALFFDVARKAGARFGILASLAIGLAATGAGTYFIGTSGGFNLWRFVLPIKAIGIVLIAIGCFVSGWLAACFTATAVKLGDSDRDRLRKAESDIKNAELKYQHEKEKRIEKEIELTDIRKELNERAGKGINVSAIESVLQLALAQSELYVTDFEGRWVDTSFKEHTLSAPTMSRFVEVVRRPFEAKFGIDLKDIRVQDNGSYLMIDGVQAKKIGSQPKPRIVLQSQPEQDTDPTSDQDPSSKEKVEFRWDYLLEAQLQEFKLKKIKRDEAVKLPLKDQWRIAKKEEQWVWVVDEETKEFDGKLNFDSKTFADCNGDHLNRVESEVYGTSEDLNTVDNRFAFINKTIIDMGRKIIEKLLEPLGKEIKFLDKKPLTEGEHTNWMPLIEFCKQSNKRLLKGVGMN